MLDIEFLTDEQDVIMLCQRYWQLASDGTFNVRLRDLAPFHGITNYGYVELIVLRKSIARDTRRRCPVCGIPQRVGSRQSALLPVTSQPPCSDCRYLKIKGIARTDETGRAASTREHKPVKKSRFSVSALVLLTALRHLIGVRLYEGFSIHDCADLTPAHSVRFINMLYQCGILKNLPGSEHVEGAEPTKYFLTDDLKLKEDFAAFINREMTSTSFDFSVLQDLWLDYAVAMSIHFICGQCLLYSLPLDPDNPELCAVLRATLSGRSIAEALSMSARAVQLVAETHENDSAKCAFPVAISHNIEQQNRLAIREKFAQQPIAKPASLPFSELGDWFKKWYGIDELTPGHIITTLMAVRIETNS